MGEVSNITPQEAASLVAEGKGKLVDVRTVGEVLAEKLSGSVFLPFDLVNKKRLEEMGVSGEIPILVCRSGTRAKQAAEALAGEMDQVAVLDGGMVKWREDGFSVDQGRRVIPLDRQVLVTAGTMMLLFSLLGLLFSPLFFLLTIFMSCGMIFAGATGACGMARILVMMPWNKAPMCGDGCSVNRGP